MLSHKSRVLSCYLVAFLDLFAVGMIMPLFNRRGRELGISPSLIGLIGSIYGGLQFFSSPYVGKASDRWGRKPILLLSFVGCIVGYFTIGVTNTILLFSLARLPTGILKHSMTSARAYLSDITSAEERAGVMGTFNAVGSMGFMVAPIIGGYVYMQENGFFKVSLLTCTVYVGAFIFVWFAFDNKLVVKPKSFAKESTESCQTVDKIFPESDSHNTDDDLRKRKDAKNTNQDSSEEHKEKEPTGISKFFSYLKIKSVRDIMDLLLIKFVMGFSMMIYRSNYTAMLDYRYGVDAKTTGYIISFGSVAGAISGMCVGKIYSFFKSDAKMMFLAGLLMAFSLFGITISPNIYAMLVCIAPLSLSTAVMRVNGHNLLLKQSQVDERGAVMGFSDSITSIARMLSPAIAGFAQEVSVIGPCWLATTFAMIGVSLMVIFPQDKPLTDKDKKKNK